jgi:tRNA/rRNA methyltransferase
MRIIQSNIQSISSNITVVLVRPNISGNIGATARAMANFGFSSLVLVDAKCQIDDEARNRAKHAQHIISNISTEKSLARALSKFTISIATTGVLGSDFNIPRTPLSAQQLSQKLQSSKIKASNKIAIVFGPEDSGLSKDELELCDYTVTIPTSEVYPVMNLSHAVTIILYELSKEHNSKRIKEVFPLIEKKEKEVLDKMMISVINSVKYRTIFEKRTQILVWKRILGKAMPTKREAFAMIGMLKKLALKKEENVKLKLKK